MDNQELVLKVCGGNPGCIRIMAQILGTSNGWNRATKIHDLGFRGPFIWLIYKDLLGGDLVKLGQLLDDNQLEDEIERRLQEDENFAKQWRYHESILPPRMKGSEV